MKRSPKSVGAMGGAVGAIAGLWTQVVRGAITLDLRVGRTVQPLGPLIVRIAARRETVFEVISSPYRDPPTRALEKKLRVIERGQDLVLAAHFTRVYGLTATTLETVRFEPPDRVHFRLVRGPVPHVVEQFELRETDEGTELEYTGELGTDLWMLGSWWGAAVARKWEATVRTALDSVKLEAERRAKRP